MTTNGETVEVADQTTDGRTLPSDTVELVWAAEQLPMRALIGTSVGIADRRHSETIVGHRT